VHAGEFRYVAGDRNSIPIGFCRWSHLFCYHDRLRDCLGAKN
jgi:hypothetical protein